MYKFASLAFSLVFSIKGILRIAFPLVFFGLISFGLVSLFGQSEIDTFELSELRKSRFTFSSVLSKEEIRPGTVIYLTNTIKKKNLNVAGKDVLVRIIPAQKVTTTATKIKGMSLKREEELKGGEKEEENLFKGTTDLKGEFVVTFPFTEQTGLYDVETIFLANDKSYQESIIINKFLVSDPSRAQGIFYFLVGGVVFLAAFIFYLFFSRYKKIDLLYYSPLFYILWAEKFEPLKAANRKLDFTFVFFNQALLLFLGAALLMADEIYFFSYYLILLFITLLLLGRDTSKGSFLSSLLVKFIFIYCFTLWLEEANTSSFFALWWEQNYSTERFSLIYLSFLLPFPLLFLNFSGIAFFHEAFFLKEIFLATVLSSLSIMAVMLWRLGIYVKKNYLTSN